jgi:hypothetical protein
MEERNGIAVSKLTKIWEESGVRFGCFTRCGENCINDHVSSCQCKVVLDAMKKLNAYEDITDDPSKLAADLAELEEYRATGLKPDEIIKAMEDCGDTVAENQWAVKLVDEYLAKEAAQAELEGQV